MQNVIYNTYILGSPLYITIWYMYYICIMHYPINSNYLCTVGL